MHHIHPAHFILLAEFIVAFVVLILFTFAQALGRNLTLALFGKSFYKFEGRQFIKEQKYLVALDIIVAKDGIDDATTKIAEIQAQLKETEDRKLRKPLEAQIDSYEQTLIQLRNKLVGHHQKLENLVYKKTLLKRL